MGKKRVVDILMDTLVDAGIENCFAVVGGGAMHIDNALSMCKRIRTIFNHHEQACAMSADAYARLSGKMAVVCVTSGPGATNALTGVMGAWLDGIPMLVISGNTRYAISKESTGLNLRYRGVQEFDIINSITNMTKYSKVIKYPNMIKYEVNKAIDIALSGRRGPVWLDIPLDIQNYLVDEDEILNFNYILPKVNLEKSNILSAFDLIKQSERPVIIAGSGLISSNTLNDFYEFCESVKVPVVGAAWIADIDYNENPMFFGLSGNIGPRSGNFIIQNADVILTLGSSLSFNETGYNVEEFAPNAKIIMVDIDENEFLKHNGKVNYFINADLKEFFSFCKSENITINKKIDWIKYCNLIKNKFDRFEAVKNISLKERVNKYYFWKKFDEISKEDCILALGNSSCNSAKLQVGKKYRNQRVITNYMCGSMGYDLPAAIGSAIASNKEVICVTGDGSIMMNLQELQTIIYNKLPIKIVVFENNGYNAIRQTCKNFFDGKEFGCSSDTGISMPNFKKIAYAFGFEYECCLTNDEVTKKLHWLFNEKRNVLLEVKEILDDPMIPKVASRIDSSGNMKSSSIQDMFPFLDQKEMDELDLWKGKKYE